MQGLDINMLLNFITALVRESVVAQSDLSEKYNRIKEPERQLTRTRTQLADEMDDPNAMGEPPAAPERQSSST